MERVSFGRRFVALMIDWVVAMLSTAALTGTPIAGDGASSSFVTLGAFLLEVGVTTGLLGYSIGKRIVSLKVENPAGRPIGLPKAIVRTAAICVVVPPLIVNDEGRGLHDVLSGSRVVPLH